MNSVRDMHDTRTRNRRREMESLPVSGAYVMGISFGPPPVPVTHQLPTVLLLKLS